MMPRYTKICTHPGENATCSQEGITSAVSTPVLITTTLLIKKVCTFGGGPCQPFMFQVTVTSNNNPQPSSFHFMPEGNQLLHFRGPGAYTISEIPPPNFLGHQSFLGDCMQTAPGSQEATGTISTAEHQTCTITNAI